MKKLLPLIPLTCLGSGFNWIAEFTLEELGLNSRIVILGFAFFIAACIGAAILFGWGFDSQPKLMLYIWIGCSFLGWVFYSFTLYGYFKALSIWTCGFGALSYVGILVILVAWCKERYEGNQIAAHSAFWVVWFIGELLSFLGLRLFRQKLVHVLFLALMIILSVVVIVT